MVSFWFGGVNRGVTDPTETSILQLITFVVSEAAVKNGGKKRKLSETTPGKLSTLADLPGGETETQEASGGA